ncbi:hypothetical protein [Novipirellula aureliae]|uniref:hypothetical protein n=1 Tax=Novipirellula aureliae TaxID=2527966 RepID=UPI0018CDDBC1|nr:hypothetical protein [Novipirellula aureliae]
MHCARNDTRGVASSTAPPILVRSWLEQVNWCKLVKNFGKWFAASSGSPLLTRPKRLALSIEPFDVQAQYAAPQDDIAILLFTFNVDEMKFLNA